MTSELLVETRLANESFSATKVSCIWEGSFFLTHSLALCNRRITQRLLDRGVDLTLVPYESDDYRPVGEEARLLGRINRPLDRPADVHVRHQWPPDFKRPPEGRWVIFQHCEFGSLPEPWIAPMRDEIDEIWVASRWGKKCFVESGVPEHKVQVIPLGTDPAVYRPDVVPMLLPTRKSFRFLFVGGTIPRKGVSALLDAYGRAFTAKDDVCLVIKDMGTRSFYRGHTAGSQIREFMARPNAPEILYLDTSFPEAELATLYTACQVFVAPYRGEGFGLPIVEAMAAGRDVIVTGYGPSLEFCTSENAVLVPAQLRHFKSRKVGEWNTVAMPWFAEVDVKSLAAAMRQSFEDPKAGRLRGAAARRDIAASWTWDHTADAVTRRLHCLKNEPRLSSVVSCPIVAQKTTCLQTPPITWTGPIFNYSGYARVSREILPKWHQRGHVVRSRSLSSDKKFIADMARNPAHVEVWRKLNAQVIQRGIEVVFHPAADWEGRGYFTQGIQGIPNALAYVGMTMFETDRLPPGWAADCNRMDEVWVPSEFNRKTFIEAGVDKTKLRVLPLGIDATPYLSRGRPYPLETGARFNFLSVFQWSNRKGWDILLRAYAQAFRASDDVCLVIRSYPSYQVNPPIRERVTQFMNSLGIDSTELPRVHVLEDHVPDEMMPALYQSCQAFVLPTRGEGWGLPYMEAMASGLPTIGTRWGAQTEFMDDENSYLINVRELVHVPKDQSREDAYYGSDHRWAEPDVDHLTQIFRKIYQNPGAARQRGEKAQRNISERWTIDNTLDAMERLCLDLERRFKNRTSPPWQAEIDSRLREWSIEWRAPLTIANGYADEARQFVLGLDELGVGVGAIEHKWSGPSAEISQEDAARLRTVLNRPLFSTGFAVLHTFPDFYPSGKYEPRMIGRTMFETDSIPAKWVAPLNTCGEVWVPSDFNLKTFRNAGVEAGKLHKIPGAIDARIYADRPDPLLLEHRRGFNFLSISDFTLRKGWDVLLRAYLSEFTRKDDVALYLKLYSTCGYTVSRIQTLIEQYIEKILKCRLEDTPDINLIFDTHPAPLMPALYRAADAFVLPSRGEGWGRPYMEAMAMGLPTIGTRWSGQLEYMNDENSFLVDCSLRPVSASAIKEAAWFNGHNWAEPDLVSLRRIMRRVFEERTTAKRIGEAARDHVLANYDRRVVAKMIVDRVDELWSRR